MTKKLRTVVTTERFHDEFREIDANPERLEVFLRRIEWRILKLLNKDFARSSTKFGVWTSGICATT